jgi:plastocyanin
MSVLLEGWRDIRLQKYAALAVIFVVVSALIAIPLRPLEESHGLVIEASDDLTFDVTHIDAHAGDEVELTLDNSHSSNTHTFVIDSMPVEGVHPESDAEGSVVSIEAEGGHETSVSFTPTEAGEYRFYCSVEGHAEAGMVGTLTVE